MNYTGGCHCGAIRFEVDMDIEKLVSCNCSICSKRAHLLVFAAEEKFKLLSGEESLTDYQFGSRKIHHYFCGSCGIGPFGAGAMPDGTAIKAVNVRCLDDVDFNVFPVSHFDGKRL